MKNLPKIRRKEKAVRVAVWLFALAEMVALTSGCTPDQPGTSSSVSGPMHNERRSDRKYTGKLGRLFWQDRNAGSIHAADLSSTDSGFEINQLEVAGLTQLDVTSHDFVQMVVSQGKLIVGVRDHADGTDKSGWLEIGTGVEEESHGDHSHWHYDDMPQLQSETLDADRGNPAHVYKYGNHVFIAQDKKNGFSMIEPKPSGSAVKFFQGGGGHITLAAVANQIAYSTWIDRSGENAGRVDVVDLKTDTGEPKYSFNLPTGGIHGATACGNRVFFAPADGVCWVDCDFDFAKTSDTVEVHHLSLSENDEDLYRTGAFETFKDHVLCIGNCKDHPPALCLIDGTTPSPSVTRFLCDDLGDDLKLSTVKAAAIKGRPFAFAFAEGMDAQEKLLVFELDANQDRTLGDIKLHKSIDVGKSQIEGHAGHHGITFLNDSRTAVISNPGDGTISVLDLGDWLVAETIDVGGQPTHVVSYGGKP